MITLYSSDYTGNPGNCSYPHEHIIEDLETLKSAVKHDYVCASYKNNYRNGENFLSSDCLPVDCDNDHSDNPNDWVTPEDVCHAFPGVRFFVHCSRSHMREKNGKSARPKFHILFPITPMADPIAYKEMKRMVNAIFPYFDNNALDSARFFFGTHNPEVECYEGDMNLSEFLDDDFDIDLPHGTSSYTISEGSRNATMSRFAGRVIKKYGDGEEAYKAFLEQAEKCSPPLDEQELMTIWRSAQKFYARVSQQEGYVAPEDFNTDVSYKPTDYSDVGQATVLNLHFNKELVYTPATSFLRYTSNHWYESDSSAQGLVQELTRRQLEEAKADLLKARLKLEQNGGLDILNNTTKAKAEAIMNPDQAEAYREYLEAVAYHKFVLTRRESKNIAAALREARPMVEISPRDLNNNPFLFCTPDATYDLRKGLDGAQEHNPEDYITNITTASPGIRGKKIWEDCLNLIFCNDQEVIDYVQQICGLAAIGKVLLEAIIIAYGCGRNGKSTFWNVINRVFGSYGGRVSADTLTAGCRRNTKPELAELHGKRLALASELPASSNLNEAMIKQICSTDDIFAEKKYKAPFAFSPSHILVLYTNYLPRVLASDDGTWRRLIVIPFNAKIEGQSEVKNYGDYLYNNAAESIVAWIIEGAKKIIDAEYKLKTPKCVQDAMDEYRNQNNWFNHFLEDKCEVDPSYRISSSELYQVYRTYCTETNEYIRSTADFYSALEKAGFERLVIERKRYFRGIKLKPEFDDFLS